MANERIEMMEQTTEQATETKEAKMTFKEKAVETGKKAKSKLKKALPVIGMAAAAFGGYKLGKLVERAKPLEVEWLDDEDVAVLEDDTIDETEVVDETTVTE